MFKTDGVGRLTGWVGAASAWGHVASVPGKPHVPLELRRAPFSIAEARAAGVSGKALRGREWRRLGRELYCWRGWQSDPWLLLAAWHRMNPSATFAGRTAAWMHGLACQPDDPVEVIAPVDAAYRTCHGRHVRHCDLVVADRISIRELPATSMHRTLRDICLRSSAVESLVFLDMALAASVTDRESMARYVEGAIASPGARRMSDLMKVAEPAESQMETRLRWLLVRAGVPAPQVQTELTDIDGRFVGRADMYYPSARVVVEYDGGNHRDRLVADDRRQNQLVNAGYTVLRFTSADLHNQPDAVVAQVRGALLGPIRPVPFVQNGPIGKAREGPFVQKGPVGRAREGPFVQKGRIGGAAGLAGR